MTVRFSTESLSRFSTNTVSRVHSTLTQDIMPVDEDRIQLSEVKELYKGHEVSCHTSTHPTIERCPLDQVVQQVIEDEKHLRTQSAIP